MKVLFATGNETKSKRFSEGLSKKGIDVISLKDFGVKLDVDENGKNAIDNALIKARAYSKITDIPVFAMDDNLFLEGVPDDKQPGMYVRRVNGKTLTDEEMIEYYSSLVKDYGTDGKLTCRWIYGIAVISNGKEYTYSWSIEDFYMVDIPSNKVNPGYPLNSISINIKYNKYFTDITDEERKSFHEDESDVVDFIVNSIKESRSNAKIKEFNHER